MSSTPITPVVLNCGWQEPHEIVDGLPFKAVQALREAGYDAIIDQFMTDNAKCNNWGETVTNLRKYVRLECLYEPLQARINHKESNGSGYCSSVDIYIGGRQFEIVAEDGKLCVRDLTADNDSYEAVAISEGLKIDKIG